jgi:hypothetical protein
MAGFSAAEFYSRGMAKASADWTKPREAAPSGAGFSNRRNDASILGDATPTDPAPDPAGQTTGALAQGQITMLGLSMDELSQLLPELLAALRADLESMFDAFESGQEEKAAAIAHGVRDRIRDHMATKVFKAAVNPALAHRGIEALCDKLNRGF